MNVVEPTIEFCDYRGLRKIELIGKVCTKQEDSIKPDSAEIFCRNRLIDGHTAIFEHEYVYFNVTSIPISSSFSYSSTNSYTSNLPLYLDFLLHMLVLPPCFPLLS